jgi:hypothetical protein
LGKMFSSLNVLHSQIVTLKCWYSWKANQSETKSHYN